LDIIKSVTFKVRTFGFPLGVKVAEIEQFIYIYIYILLYHQTLEELGHSLTRSGLVVQCILIYIVIYIYMCVCVCVCVERERQAHVSMEMHLLTLPSV
jgi:hypothetical protein